LRILKFLQHFTLSRPNKATGQSLELPKFFMFLRVQFLMKLSELLKPRRFSILTKACTWFNTDVSRSNEVGYIACGPFELEEKATKSETPEGTKDQSGEC
jgi:hypothetical protein